MNSKAMEKSYRFRCVRCGEGFNVSDEDDQLYSEGYYTFEPDICDDCDMYNTDYEIECHSDADPGL